MCIEIITFILIHIKRDITTERNSFERLWKFGLKLLMLLKGIRKLKKNVLKILIDICFVRYRYSKDDEEIYKEFMEIANDLIPHTVKAASLDPKTYKEVLKRPDCFASILRYGNC